jgi:hypothetical protein
VQKPVLSRLAPMARKLSAVERIDEEAAVKRVEGTLLKKA